MEGQKVGVSQFYAKGEAVVDWSQLWDIQNFRFDPSTVPFASWQLPFYSSFGYLLAVFLFWLYMRDKKEMKLKFLTEIHNVILCVWSMLMCIGVGWGTVQRALERGGIGKVICDDDFDKQAMTGILGYWSYIYYLSKYYEWLDTFLMIAKKRPLTVLHVWHHFIIVPMSWSWLYGDWVLMWYGALFNTGIHVFMYFYYFSSSMFNHRPWWKKYLTSMQILQFFTVFIMIWVFCFYFILETPSLNWNTTTTTTTTATQQQEFLWFLPGLEFARGCKGEPWVIVLAQGVNITFLILFINFYIQSYQPRKKKHE